MTGTQIVGKNNNYNTNYNWKIIKGIQMDPRGGRWLGKPSLRSLDLVLGDVNLVDTRATMNPRAQWARVFIGFVSRGGAIT